LTNLLTVTAFCWTALGCVPSNQRPAAEVVSPKKIDVPWMKPGNELEIGYQPPLSDPLDARRRLYVVTGGRWQQVRSLSILAGHVRIRSADQALHFVRLRTSPTTSLAFEGTMWAEVLPRTAVDSALTFGDHTLIRTLKQAREGLYGVLSADRFAELGFHLPTVSMTAGGYKVRRVVVVLPRGAHGRPIVQWISEQVSSDGSYRITGTELVTRKDVARIPWAAGAAVK
jgi:hypothetical protein